MWPIIGGKFEVGGVNIAAESTKSVFLHFCDIRTSDITGMHLGTGCISVSIKPMLTIFLGKWRYVAYYWW